jgi:hypothetical protein
MTTIANVFGSAPAFTVAELTETVNLLPPTFGRVAELGIFQDRPVGQRTVILEEYAGVLNLLPTQPVGAPGTKGHTGKRTDRPVVLPFIPHDDVILPEEVQGVRAFGPSREAMAMEDLYIRKLTEMRNKYDITWEWQRINALQGKILDADGSTLLDLFAAFGVTQQVINFHFSDTTIDVLSICRSISRYIELHLFGDVMQGPVRAMVAPDFFDALVTHPSVKTAYQYYASVQNPLRTDVRTGFLHGNILFEEYLGYAADPGGTSRQFIPASTGIAFPMGTRQTFFTYYGPGDFLDTVNMPGMPIYARQNVRDFNRGIDLHMQSSPLPICRRPAVLVKLTMS